MLSRLPTSGRISPVTNPDTEFFWAGLAEQHLLVQQCVDCKQLRHPPGPGCPYCHSLDWEATEVSGRGLLHSYGVVHYPQPPGFEGPAVVVVVELDEGIRIVSNVECDDPDTLRIGEPLEVFFLTQDEGWTVPQFRRCSE
jgi:uncharacterized OB-fold protein